VTELEISTTDILQAALVAFAEEGYTGTSVREVARSLGGSHNLIPNRIGSKDDLWYAAIDYGVARLFAALATTFADDSYGSDLERLRAVMTRFIEANVARPALSRVIAQESATPGPRLDHLYDRWIEPVRLFGEEMLGRLRASGEVNVDSVGLVFLFMVFGGGGPGAFPALADRFGAGVDRNDAKAVRAYAETAADFMFDGLLARRNGSQH
jgi:AcrR family transcriptional regulator